MIDKKALKIAFGAPFAANGYVRKGQSWYKESGGVLRVVELQKSSYGDFYFINVGFNFTSVSGSGFVPEYDCHISMRVGTQFVDARLLYRLMSRTCEELDPQEHADGIRDLSEKVVAFTEDVGTVENLRSAYRRGDLKSAGIRVEVLPFLEQPRPPSTAGTTET